MHMDMDMERDLRKTGGNGKDDMKISHILYEPVYTKHIHSRHCLIKL